MNSLQIVRITTTQGIKDGSNGIITGIPTSEKSIIPITLKYKNWVVLFSGNER